MDNLTKTYKFLGFELIPKNEKKIKENLKQIKLININLDDPGKEPKPIYVIF